MAAQLGNRDIIDCNAHVVNPGTSGSRDFPCRRYQPIAEFARPDEGDVALRRNSALIMGVAGKGERRIRQQENEAAMGDAVSVDHVGLTVIVRTASPALICRISMPRPLLASSSFHIASTQARARSSGEGVALRFTAVFSPICTAARRSGSGTRRSSSLQQAS